MAVCGRPFLSERSDDNRFRYYKGGLSAAKPTRPLPAVRVGTALRALAHPTLA
jgi:hypothetical protein